MSTRTWAREWIRQGLEQGQNQGFDELMCLRDLLGEIVEQSRKVRSEEDLAHELQFLADNLDDEQDYPFMRP